MRKLVLSLVLTFGLLGGLKAQQDPQFTMFWFNKMFFNPAYAGAKGGLCGTILGRFQWNGLPGAPNTYLITADMPISLGGNNQIGVGLTTYGDFIGFQQDFGLKVAGCYRRLNLGPGNLAVGFDLGFANKNINPTSWIYPDGPEGGIPPVGINTSNFGFDLSLGVYYHSTKFYGGVSVLHLTGSDFVDLNVRQARHMYFTGGYTFENIGGSNWSLNPNAMIRTDFATANFDINLNALYDFNGSHGIFFGATYRYIDAIGINVGYNGKFNDKMSMLFGYNYDINTSRLNSFNSGSHELILRFCYTFEKKRDVFKRYIVRFGDTLQNRN